VDVVALVDEAGSGRDHMSQELQRSRERLVAAREEERRRLRRDLHDGLGPILTAVTLKADAARSTLATAPDRAGGLLTELRADAKQAIGDLRRVLAYFATPPATPTPFPELTAREREVLDLLAAGRSNHQIAQQLTLSGKTVANHRSAIFAKLQVADRTQAILRARDADLGHP
jgi:DNA-binding NarL/FixJ family response regulator